MTMLKELSEDLNSIKKIQSETIHSLTEIKNNLQGNNSVVDEAENQINNLEHKEEKNTQSEEQENIMQKHEDRLRSLWDNFKRTNIQIIGVTKGEEKQQEIENFLFKDFIYLFLERGREEKDRERYVNVRLLFMYHLLGTWPTTQACALTGN